MTVPTNAASRLTDFSPPSAPSIAFTIARLTSTERDELAGTAFAAGIRPVDQGRLRTAMVMALFEPIGDESVEAAEERGEAEAAMLDRFWEDSAIYELAVDRWVASETQRMANDLAGVAVGAPAPRPVRLVSIRDRARATLLIENVIDRSQTLRSLMAEALSYPRRAATVHARKQIVSVRRTDIDSAPWALDRDQHGLLTPDSIELIQTSIGPEAWAELISFLIADGERAIAAAASAARRAEPGAPAPGATSGIALPDLADPETPVAGAA